MSDTTATTFQRVSTTAYVLLMTNVVVGMLALPAVLLYLSTDPADTWHALILLAPLMAPVAVAAFSVLARFTSDGSITVVRTFGRALRRGFRKALVVGAQATAAAFVLVIDIGVLWGTRWGAVAIPVLTTLLLALIATTATVLVALAHEPGADLARAWRAALVLSVRRWYLSAVSLVALGMLTSAVLTQPALGLGLICTPVLYVVWANAQVALRPVLSDDGAAPAW